MSTEAIRAVWKMDLPPSEKFVLEAYADHADRTGGSIFPSLAMLTRKTGLSRRSLQLLSRKLQAVGVLAPDGAGPRGTRRWRIQLDWAAPGAAPQGGKSDSRWQ
ncbi:MAG TPA: helix-turn-helix domain-containing protein, partial [Anaerolineales bacterium]|nr:helix-turn-helix domain-containing protein [Anaerolineales bacterium]